LAECRRQSDRERIEGDRGEYRDDQSIQARHARQWQEVSRGSKIVKIEWTAKKSAESPYFVMVPDILKSVSFIEKDSKRFPNTGGWGYAQFHYDGASDTFQPFGNDAACGHACHTAVAAKDYIFTAYPKR
jgi:hypothetical protein